MPPLPVVATPPSSSSTPFSPAGTLTSFAIVPSPALLSSRDIVSAPHVDCRQSPHPFGLQIRALSNEHEKRPLPMFYVSPEAARDRAPLSMGDNHDDDRQVNAPGVVSGWYVMAEPGTKYDVVVCRVNNVADVDVDCYDNGDDDEGKDKNGDEDAEEEEEEDERGAKEDLKSVDNNNNNKQKKKTKKKNDSDNDNKLLPDRKSKKHRHGSSTSHHHHHHNDDNRVTKKEGRRHHHHHHHHHSTSTTTKVHTHGNDNDRAGTQHNTAIAAALQTIQCQKKRENERDFQVSLRIDGQSTHTGFTFPRYATSSSDKQQHASVWIGFKEKSVTTVTTRRSSRQTSSSNGVLSKVIAKRRRTYRLFKFAKTINGDGYDLATTMTEGDIHIDGRENKVNESLGVVQMKVYIGKSIPRPLSMSGHIKDSGNQRFRRKQHTRSSSSSTAAAAVAAAAAAAVEHADNNTGYQQQQQQQQHGAVSENIAMKKGVSLFTAGDEQVEEVGSSFIFLRARQVYAAGLTVLVRERHWLMSRRIINQYGNACSYDMFRMLTTGMNHGHRGSIINNKKNRMATIGGSGGNGRRSLTPGLGCLSQLVLATGSQQQQQQHAHRRQTVLSQQQQQKLKQLYPRGNNKSGCGHLGVVVSGSLPAHTPMQIVGRIDGNLVDDDTTGAGAALVADIKPKLKRRPAVTDFIDLT